MTFNNKILDCNTHRFVFLKSLFEDKYPTCVDVINLVERIKFQNFDYSVVILQDIYIHYISK